MALDLVGIVGSSAIIIYPSSVKLPFPSIAPNNLRVSFALSRFFCSGFSKNSKLLTLIFPIYFIFNMTVSRFIFMISGLLSSSKY